MKVVWSGGGGVVKKRDSAKIHSNIYRVNKATCKSTISCQEFLFVWGTCAPKTFRYVLKSR